MSLTNLKYISADDSLGDSRVNINDNFDIISRSILDTQEVSIIAQPKGTRGTLRIGDGLTITPEGYTSIDLNTTYFTYNNTQQITFTDFFLNASYVKKVGDVMSGPLTFDSVSATMNIGTETNTDYKLSVGGSTNLQSTINLPCLPSTSFTQILSGTGDGASYNIYNTVIRVSNGLVIQNRNNQSTIVFNSRTGDILLKNNLSAANVNVLDIQNLNNSIDLNLNNGIFINNNTKGINLSSVSTTSSPPLSTDRSNRVATTSFVRSNLDTLSANVHNLNNSVDPVLESLNLYIKKTGGVVTGDLIVPAPISDNSIVNKRYVLDNLNTITNICNRVDALDGLSRLLKISINVHPQGVTINEPSTTQLSVHAIPDNISFLPISYQWRKDGVNILNATSSTLTVGEPGVYSCVCRNPISEAISNSAQVNVNRRVNIVADPVSQTLTQNIQTVVLSTNTTGTEPILYQWKKNNIDIAGANSKSLNVTSSGRYSCVASNMVNSVLSKDAIISSQINIQVSTTYSNHASIPNTYLAQASHSAGGDTGNITYTNLYNLFRDNFRPESVILYGYGERADGYINGNQILHTDLVIDNYVQEITWGVTVDGSDFYAWTPGSPSSTLNVTHRSWQWPGVPSISYKTYKNNVLINSGSLKGTRVGSTSLPFEILQTTDVSLSFTGRYQATITGQPTPQNSYTTTVLINDDPPASNAWYSCTLTYRMSKITGTSGGSFRTQASITPSNNGSFTYRSRDNGAGAGYVNFYIEGYTYISHDGAVSLVLTSPFAANYNASVNGTTKMCPVNISNNISPLPAGTYPLIIQEISSGYNGAVNITIPSGSGTTSFQKYLVLTG